MRVLLRAPLLTNSGYGVHSRQVFEWLVDKKIDLTEVWENIVSHAQKYQPAEDADIDDEQAVPLNENATQVSFDNFEKENASEKKRKKIYMTETEIQKLIDKRKTEMTDSDDLADKDSEQKDFETEVKNNTE